MQIWKNYFFTADFSDVAAYLQARDVGHVFEGDDAVTLAGFFQDHDPRESKRYGWCANRPGHDMSVDGAVVTYNGKNDVLMPTNSKFTHVMAVDFSKTECDQPCGKVYLHYNA